MCAQGCNISMPNDPIDVTGAQVKLKMRQSYSWSFIPRQKLRAVSRGDSLAFRNIIWNSHTRALHIHRALSIYMYDISTLSIDAGRKGGFRAHIFCRAPQEITLLSTNSARPLDLNDVARENSAVTVSVERGDPCIIES